MTSLIIISGIIGLILVSLTPWITYENTYLSIESMANSENLEIKGLVGDLENISLCFWLLIIFSLISMVGLAIHILGSYSSIAKILMLIGCTNIIFSISVSILIHFIVIPNIEETNSISAALISSSLPIKYAYLPIVISVISLIGSILYTGYIVSFSIKGITNLKKDDLSNKKTDDDKKIIFKKPIQKEIEFEKTQREETIEIPKPQMELQETIEPEKKVMLTPPPIRETYQEPDLKQPSEPEDPMVQPLISKEPPDMQEKPRTPFKEEKTDQTSEPKIISETMHGKTPKSDEKPPISPIFERALSSAIEKRHIETPKEVKEKKHESESK